MKILWYGAAGDAGAEADHATWQTRDLPRAFPHWSASPRGTAGSRPAMESPAAGSTSGTGCPCPRKKTIIQTKAVILTKNKNKIWRRQMTKKLKSVVWIRDILVRIWLWPMYQDPNHAIFALNFKSFSAYYFLKVHLNNISTIKKEVTKQ
jgi:hypothetical protein